jgi:hypothetical protein
MSLPWDMPTRERVYYDQISMKAPEDRSELEALCKRYIDLTAQLAIDLDCVRERAQRAEQQLAEAKAEIDDRGLEIDHWKSECSAFRQTADALMKERA